MTRRSIINLSAFAIIAGGGLMLLDARPAAAAALSSGCDKMNKVVEAEAASCNAGGGTYIIFGAMCSSTSVWYDIDATCKT